MSIIDWSLDKWLSNVALAALSHKETLLATYDIARSVIDRAVHGDFVECGVFGGAQCAVMARAIMLHSDTPRRVHLFDSFEGVPAAGEHDRQFAAAGHQPGVSTCSLEAVMQHMDEWGIPEGLLVYHPGLFSHTLRPSNEGTFAESFERYYQPKQIALLRLDADLYESTKVCLDNLYPLLSPGGWLIVDDYGLDGCRKAVSEYFSGNYPPIYMQRMPE